MRQTALSQAKRTFIAKGENGACAHAVLLVSFVEAVVKRQSCRAGNRTCCDFVIATIKWSILRVRSSKTVRGIWAAR